MVALLLEQPAEEMPTPPPRSKGKKRRSVVPVKIIPSPQEIKNAASKAFSTVKNSILELHDSAKKTLKGNAEGEARKKNQEDIDLTPHEHERALKGAYRSFAIPGAPKTDIDSYFDQTKPHIKTLIKNQLKEMESANIIMTLWVIWKMPIKLLIELDPEDLEDAGDKGRPAPPVNPSPQKMDEFEKKETSGMTGWLIMYQNQLKMPPAKNF